MIDLLQDSMPSACDFRAGPTKPVVTLLLELSRSGQQRSAWELVRSVEEKLGLKARWQLVEALEMLVGGKETTSGWRANRYPGGMADNSPTFQRWGRNRLWVQVPKGRLKRCARSAVPSGLIMRRMATPNVETLGYCRQSLRDRVVTLSQPFAKETAR